jgi:hypothetical protein
MAIMANALRAVRDVLKGSVSTLRGAGSRAAKKTTETLEAPAHGS